MSINDVICYIDKRFEEQDSEHRGWWTDLDGEPYYTDIAYAFEWWNYCMKPELLKILKNELNAELNILQAQSNLQMQTNNFYNGVI